jgi:predicted MFS family arabinose efflux permease
MGTAELGLWLGLIFGLSGIAGVLLGGYVSRRWFVHSEKGQMRASAFAVSLTVPWFVAFLTLSQRYYALIALIPLFVVLSFFLAPTYALLQRLVSDDMRATALAVVLLVTNLIGMGIGPQVVGVISDLLMPSMGADSLRYAMLIMSFVALWASYHFWMVGQTVREDLAMATGTPANGDLGEVHAGGPKPSFSK